MGIIFRTQIDVIGKIFETGHISFVRVYEINADVVKTDLPTRGVLLNRNPRRMVTRTALFEFWNMTRN